MATGFEKLQSALDLSKFEDLFTSRKQLVLGKLGLVDKVGNYDEQVGESLIALSKFSSATTLAAIKQSVIANKDFWSKVVRENIVVPDDISEITDFFNDENPRSENSPKQPELSDLKQAAQSFLDVLLEIRLEEIQQKCRTIAEDYTENFKKLNNFDVIALFNAKKILTDEQWQKRREEINQLNEGLRTKIEQLQQFKATLTINDKNAGLGEQVKIRLGYIEQNLSVYIKEHERIHSILNKLGGKIEDHDYLALENGVTYSVKNRADYKPVNNGSDGVQVFSGLPEAKIIKYLKVEKRGDDQVGVFEKSYKKSVDKSSYQIEGDAKDPHWKSIQSPANDTLLAEHTTRWAIDIIRQNGLPTKDRPLYIEEGSENEKESKFLVIALMKVLKITSKDEANLLIKTDHTDWKPSDELSYIGGGFGRFSTYNSAFKDNKDVQKILANFENKNVVMMEIGKDFSYVERNEPQQPAVEKKLPILNQNQGIIDSEVLAKNQQDFKENLKHITQESLDSKKESTTSTTTTTPLEKNEESGSGMGMGPNG